MRSIHLLFIATAFFLLSAPGFADTPSEASAAASPDSVASEAASPAAPNEAAEGLAWEQLEDPNFAPEPANNAEGSLDEASSVPNTIAEIEVEKPIPAGVELTDAIGFEASRGIVLGPEGVDDQGRKGRLHTVSSGDTLWDLAAAYLGTPWVWPSVWIDNDEIDNPHLIMPGDRIWITANEMRVVSHAEAVSFLEPAVLEPEDTDPPAMQVADPIQPLAAPEPGEGEPSMLDAFPAAVAGESPESMATSLQVTVSRRHAMGFVSTEDLAGASSIVDSPVERTFLAEGDPVVLGMGEGDVAVGDQFTIFQVIEEVRDVETNRILGHHVDVLGWLEVKELTGDTSIGEIRMSYAMMERGVRVMPRPMLSSHVTVRSTPNAIEGKIVFLPSERALMADGGYVYLNRGEFHGVEIGSGLEVYEAGMILNDRTRRVDVRTPDRSVAKLVVVSVTSESSVAFVVSSSRELEVGDDVRPRISRLARR